MSSAQPRGELHSGVHFVRKQGPERSDGLSRDSSLIDGAGNPPPAAPPESRI